jgi:cytochrome c1
MDVAQKLVDIPHTGFKSNYKRPPHPIATAPEKQAINLIKSQDSKNRMVSYNTMVHGIDEHPNRDNISANPTTSHHEHAVEERFNANDLHHFHDDPHLPAARLVAQYGDIDKVAHKMKDHPDGEVQRIVKGRISRAGGEKALIPQRPEPEPISNDPDQFKMKLPTPKKKA